MNDIDFCDKCGSVLIPQRKGSSLTLVCRKCGKKASTKGKKDFKITISTSKKAEKIVVVDKKAEIEVLPRTEAQCPKCEHGEAYWWMQQTRAADEAPTRFYRCVKCGHTWREYS